MLWLEKGCEEQYRVASDPKINAHALKLFREVNSAVRGDKMYQRYQHNAFFLSQVDAVDSHAFIIPAGEVVIVVVICSNAVV